MKNLTIEDFKYEFDRLENQYQANKAFLTKKYFTINPLRTKEPIKKCLDSNFNFRKLRLSVENRIFDLNTGKCSPISSDEKNNLELLLQNCIDRINFLDFYYNKIMSETTNNNALFALSIALISILISIVSFFPANPNKESIDNLFSILRSKIDTIIIYTDTIKNDHHVLEGKYDTILSLINNDSTTIGYKKK